MCTILLSVPRHPGDPLLIAGNRDELIAREASPPQPWDDGAFWAGRDLAHGGTWLGCTTGGFFAALTNQRTMTPGRRFPQSRGELVANLLRGRDPAEARRFLETLDPLSFGECNLLFGTSDACFVAYLRHSSARVHLEAIEPGLHVLPNDILDSPDFSKVVRAREVAAPTSPTLPSSDEQLTAALRDHRRDPLDEVAPPPAGSALSREFIRELTATCVHTPSYGTRSAALLHVDRAGLARYVYADGPPCTTPFATVYERPTAPP